MLPARIGLRWVIVALTLSIVAPLGVLSAVSLERAWTRQRANVDRQNIATARAISVAIDTDVETTTAALDVFATLHALDNPDLAAFDNLARRLIVRQHEWSSLILADGDNRVLAAFPDRDVDMRGTPAEGWARTTIATKRPIVSNLFTLPDMRGSFVMIAVPVLRDGQVHLALGARVRSDTFSAILREQQTPPRDIVALVDSTYRIVARTAAENVYVGTPVTQAFIDIASKADEGSWDGVSREGVTNYAAFSRSRRTGLMVALAIPRDEVDGPIRRALWILVGLWVAILSVGAGVGLLFGQNVVRVMQSASRSAMALARGEKVEPLGSRIAEIDDLSTALRLAAETLEARNRERDEASRLKDEFLMTVSHELRTPLTAIYGWARMLSNGQLREEQTGRALAAIERNAKALEQLVNDILDVSRVVAGKLRLEVQPVIVSEVVAAAVDAIRPAAVAKHIAVTTTASAQGELIVSGDAGRLQQVVWNLLSNAVRFTPAGGRIDVEIARVAESITIAVRDTGPGIDSEFLPHVFERFRQGGSGTTRAHGGLGLGLAIVRHLTELHGGTVSASNNTDRPGAVFQVVLPARASARVERHTAATLLRGDPQPATARLDGLAVLVVDDDLNARELLVAVLDTAGAEVRAAASTEDALMILDGWTPDVLMSDIEMPGEDGYELMRRVRALSGLRGRIAAVALTAHARPEDRARALEAGFQWHLAKPIDPAELVAAIAALASHRADTVDSHA